MLLARLFRSLVPLLASTPVLAQLPFVFEASGDGGFVARRPGMLVHVDAGGARLQLPGAGTLQVELAGAAARGVGPELPLPGRSHRFVGGDPAAWQRGVPHCARVRCADAWRGIDVVWHAREGVFEYDFVVAPGADPRLAAVAFRGADHVEVHADGSIELTVGDARLLQRAPVAWQVVAGERRSVAVAVHERAGAVVFEPGPYDPGAELVIDPQIVYGTYLGGSSADAVHAIGKDAAGNLYLAGITASANFPVVMPLQPAIRPLYDVFVTKLDATGSTILWSTFVGGSSGGFGTDEWPVALAVADGGEVAVLARTEATDFPTVAAAQPQLAGGVDAVVFVLDPSGSQLLWSTYLGGSGDEIDVDNTIGGGGGGVLFDAGGNVFVAGTTWSSDFPVLNAHQPFRSGGSDVFVASYAPNGTRAYASYHGGAGFDELRSASPGESGRALLVGSTTGGFPTTPGVFDRTGSGSFVESFHLAGQATIWATTFQGDLADAAVDALDDVYVVGGGSFGFRTTMGAHQVDHGGSFQSHPQQGIAAKLAAGASSLVWSTYYGSPSDNESFTDVVVDAFGHVYAAGTTSEHFGSTSSAALLVKFNPQGSSVVYATDIANRNSGGRDLLLAGAGDVWIAGETWASGVATAGAPQTAHGGNKDGFLVRVEDRAAVVRELKFPVDRLTASDQRTGTVTLDGTAPAGGAVVSLASSSPDVTVPASVVVPAGSTTALVPITSARVRTTQQVTITATWNGSSDQAVLRLWPGPLFRATGIEVPGSPNGTSEGLGIDAFGTVVGTTGYAAFRWHEASGLTMVGPGEAHGIGDDGAIGGGTGAQAFRWTPGGGQQSLPSLQPGMFSIGYDADHRGRVVGFSDFDNGSVTGRRAVVWTNGVAANLGTLGGDASVGYATNRLGAVTGSSQRADFSEHPFLWTAAGGMQDLGVLPGYQHGTGFDVNDANQVAGIALSFSSLRAFRWAPGSGFVDLGVLPGDLVSGARGINAFGWTVGWSSMSQANTGRAMRHVEGAMQSLHDELSAEDAFEWKLVTAARINDAGQITGAGDFRTAGGRETAFRLDPALHRPYGRGCAGLDGRVTALAGTGHPAAGNTVRFWISGRPGAIAAIVFGTGAATSPFPGGCELHLAGASASTPLVVLDAAGTAVQPIVLPSWLPRGSLFVQAATLDDASPNGTFTTSNGVELRVL